MFSFKPAWGSRFIESSLNKVLCGEEQSSCTTELTQRKQAVSQATSVTRSC